jgi:hypothetical protein
VERRHREFEAEAGHEQDEGDGEKRITGVRRREVAREDGEVRGAGRAVEKRGSVEDEAGRECAHQKVLEARFVGDGDAAVEANQDEDADREKFEAEDDDEKVEPLGHHHHADRAPHQQGVELAALEPFARQVGFREERGQDRGQQERAIEDHGDGADLVRAAEEVAADCEQLAPAGGDEDDHGQRRGGTSEFRREGVEEDQQNAAEREDQLGEDGVDPAVF